MNIENKKIPECVGFVMDGNRRWAKGRGVNTAEGHAKGFEVMKQMINSVYESNISHMVCYAFSTENWNRSTEEVDYLMSLIRSGLQELASDYKDDDRKVCFKIIGEHDRLPKDLEKDIQTLEDRYFDDPELTVWVAISYGGRTEIINAVNKAVKNGEKVDEKTFKELMWTADMPDPDLVIRTSGERRLSNFLLWQVAYSELFFTDTLWPDFGEEEFKSMLKEYEGRQRRKGK